jgi:cobalt-zinc-cadmium efflux system protein
MPAHESAHAPHHPHGSSLRLLLSLGLVLGFAGVEALAGWWSGSLALLGDAGHMVTDASALGLAALAAWIARAPPTARLSYGAGRVDVLAALFNGLFMLAIVAAILIAAVQRLHTPVAVQGGVVMGVAAIGLGINLLVAYILGHGEHTLNTQAALLHVMGDLLGSIAALLSGAVIAFTGWTPIDPLLSMLIGALILYSSLRLLREVVHVLMEGVPLHLSLPEIGRAMSQVEGVKSVHDLHIWTLDSGRVALSAHVLVDNLEEWELVWHRLAQLLDREYHIEHITVQPEPWRRTVYPLARLRE